MPRRKQTEGEKKIDISQMAEDLGVSKTTVSRALSDVNASFPNHRDRLSAR